jgi:hypothetical protein
VAFLRRRRQQLRQQNSAQDTLPHQLLDRTLHLLEGSVNYRVQEEVTITLDNVCIVKP